MKLLYLTFTTHTHTHTLFFQILFSSTCKLECLATSVCLEISATPFIAHCIYTPLRHTQQHRDHTLSLLDIIQQLSHFSPSHVSGTPGSALTGSKARDWCSSVHCTTHRRSKSASHQLGFPLSSSCRFFCGKKEKNTHSQEHLPRRSSFSPTASKPASFCPQTLCPIPLLKLTPLSSFLPHTHTHTPFLRTHTSVD